MNPDAASPLSARPWPAAAGADAAPGPQGLPRTETLLLQAQGPVLHVTLHRPAQRNAMSLAMVDELRATLAAAERDGQTRVLVLRGAQGHFCAGADLRDMAAARARLADDPQALERTNATFGELCGAFAASGLAVVAVLEGTVMGGGLGLACVADVTLAAESAVCRLPETALGLVPAQIAPFLVERLGWSQARRLAVTGGSLDATQALRIGLVHEVHAAAALDAALQRTLADILRCAPGALAATKALMAQTRWAPAAHGVALAARAFAAAALSPEGVEGTMAFLQKRPPHWAPAPAADQPMAG